METYDVNVMSRDQLIRLADLGDPDAIAELLWRMHHLDAKKQKRRAHVIKADNIELTVILPENVKLTVRSVTKLTERAGIAK